MTKIGTTSFSFRYLLLDEARAPSLETIVRRARALGLERLQICENARPLALGDDAWDALVDTGSSLGLEILIGCKTLEAADLERFIRRAARVPSRLLRVVLEEEDEHGAPPSRAQIVKLLAGAWPLLRDSGVRLAIENHFDVSSRLLAELVEPYPADRVGFCLDTANSLRSFESADDVFARLGDRAFCYHLKDFKVVGHMLGFTVGGAPLGQGQLDIDVCLDRMFRKHREPQIFIENWVPPTNDWAGDVAADETWLAASIETLRARLGARSADATPIPLPA